jgi:hypothetical protein
VTSDGCVGSAIVVLRDRCPVALQHPDRRVMRGLGDVTYVHTSNTSSLPEGRHYVFNLERLDDRSRALASLARSRGAVVTLILRDIDESTADFLLGTTMNVIPSYGDAEHIGVGTLKRALRLSCDRVPVVARGLLENSGSVGSRSSGACNSPFVRLLQEISHDAKRHEAVVAAVLAPHRTGSQWLRDLLGWTVGARVRVCHEHYVPPDSGERPSTAGLVDVLAREVDGRRQRLLRRAAVRHTLLGASRRYIFVTYRDPVERLVSYFVKRHSGWLREQLDVASQAFLDTALVQQRFESWLPDQVQYHSRWFRTTLFDHFGLEVCRTQTTEDGLLVGRHGANRLIVVPTEQLNSLKKPIELAYGPDTCSVLAEDSASARGDGPIKVAFQLSIRVPLAVERALWRVPEAAFILAHSRALATRSGKVDHGDPRWTPKGDD